MVANVFFRCNPQNPPGTISGPECVNATLYSEASWCGAIKDPSGVWATCLKVIFYKSLNSFEIKTNLFVNISLKVNEPKSGEQYFQRVQIRRVRFGEHW